MDSVQPSYVKDWGRELWSMCRFPHLVCIQMRCMIHAVINWQPDTPDGARAKVLNYFMYAYEKEPTEFFSNRKIDEGDWMDLPSITFTVEKSLFLLPVEPVVNSSRLSTGVSVDLLQQCTVVLNKLLLKPIRRKVKSIFFTKRLSIVVLLMSNCHSIKIKL